MPCKGKFTEAVRAFDRLVELQPKSPKAHIRRGLVFKSAAQRRGGDHLNRLAARSRQPMQIL